MIFPGHVKNCSEYENFSFNLYVIAYQAIPNIDNQSEEPFL
jgi:hypothetical protein